MLQAVDERLSIWGWETGTGTRFAIVVDAWGKGGNRAVRGLGDGDLRGVSYHLLSWFSRDNGRGVTWGVETLIRGAY